MKRVTTQTSPVAKKRKIEVTTTYCTLLRGINISGQKCIRMAELREILTTNIPKLQNLRTYIQTGNLIYEATKTAKCESKYWSQTIETELEKAFGYPISAITRERTHLQQIFNDNPYGEAKGVFITFLDKKPPDEAQEKLPVGFGSPDKFLLKEEEIFVNCLSGYTKSKLTNNNFEKLLSVTATTRNVNTVKKLLSL